MRYEFKYLIPNHRLGELRNALLPFLDYDPFTLHRPGKEYTIRSIYFDSPKLVCYHEKIEGFKVRKKLRVRGYNELDGSSKVFLEIKRKYEQFISKSRALVNYSDLEDLFLTRDIDSYVINKSGYPEDAKKFFYHMNAKYMIPLIIITYEREAFFSKFNPTTRITFDKNLRSAPFRSYDELYDESNLKNMMPNHFVLEVKFEKYFSVSLQRILSKFNLNRVSVSKYVIGIESDPGLQTYTGTRRLHFSNPVFDGKFYNKEAI